MTISQLQARVLGGSIVELKGGTLTTSEAVVLALRLESEGHALTAKDSKLYVTNKSTLTADDYTAIERQRFQLLAIAGYESPA